jgi:hypothetical protein
MMAGFSSTLEIKPMNPTLFIPALFTLILAAYLIADGVGMRTRETLLYILTLATGAAAFYAVGVVAL